MEIPESVTELGYAALQGMTNITEVKLPSGLEELPGGIMSYSYSLECIGIPEKITKIPQMAFFGSDNLSRVTLPACVEEIETQAFGACPSLYDVYYGGTKERAQAIVI